MTGPAESGKTSQHPLPANVLYCSRIEIYRILQGLEAECSLLSAETADGRMFMSRVLSVDPATDHFVIDYCANKSLNSALYDFSALEITAYYRGGQVVFQVSHPSDTQFNAQPALQFAFPQSLIFHHRREHPRIPAPRDVSLRCVADEGNAISFEARITDISLDGMGGMLYDSGIVLVPGTVLKGCRIITPYGEAIAADIKVRYTVATTLPDGTLARRAGVRFMQRPEQIEALIDMFIRDLDDAKA